MGPLTCCLEIELLRGACVAPYPRTPTMKNITTRNEKDASKNTRPINMEAHIPEKNSSLQRVISQVSFHVSSGEGKPRHQFNFGKVLSGDLGCTVSGDLIYSPDCTLARGGMAEERD